MFGLRKIRRTHNHNILLAEGNLNVIGGLLAIIMWGSNSPRLVLVGSFCILTGSLTILLMMNRQKLLSDFSTTFIFGANLLPVYWLLWVYEAVLASQGKIWVPFQPNELSCLAIAILAPPIRIIGVIAILLFPVLASLQYTGFSPEQIARLPSGSLFAPVAFAVFGLILYIFRLRGIWIADFSAKTDAEALMIKKVTHTILAIKDLANSPIQALTLDSETLKRKHPEDSEIAKRIEKSTRQLRDLNRILDEQLRGSLDSSIETSFDPYESLKKTRR